MGRSRGGCRGCCRRWAWCVALRENLPGEPPQSTLLGLADRVGVKGWRAAGTEWSMPVSAMTSASGVIGRTGTTWAAVEWGYHVDCQELMADVRALPSSEAAVHDRQHRFANRSSANTSSNDGLWQAIHPAGAAGG